MRRIDRLKKEALESCKWREHDMSRFDDGISTCKTCGAYVCVNENPAPNEIDIGGPAVAMNCPVDPKWL